MAPQPRSTPGSDIEERWRKRLADARRRHDHSVEAFRDAAEVYRAQEIPFPDGGLRLHKALMAESAARREYIRVLRLFTDLILYGQIPKDDLPGQP